MHDRRAEGDACRDDELIDRAWFGSCRECLDDTSQVLDWHALVEQSTQHDMKRPERQTIPAYVVGEHRLFFAEDLHEFLHPLAGEE